jgi:PAS domain S-box-containing protein
MDQHALSADEIITLVDSLQKTIFFDISLALDAYGQVEDTALLKQRQQTTSDSEPYSQEANDRTDETDGTGITGGSRPAGSPHPSVNGMTRIRISDEETAARAEFIGLTSDSRRHLQSILPAMERMLDLVLGDFYQFVRSCPPLSEIVPEAQVSRLIRQVTAYWREFLEGQFDRRHAASRMRIGVIHESIGLSPPWYVAGLCRQISGILRGLPRDTADLPEVLKRIFRGVLFDMTFVIDAYMDARAASLLEIQGFAQQLMAGLSSAVVIVGHQNHILFANESFLELTGIEPAMLYMRDLASVLPQQEVLDSLSQKRARGLNRANCMSRWGERLFRVTLVRLQESAETPPESTAIVFDDVSDVVHLSKNIEQDSRQYHNLANAVTAVLWEMDWDTRIIHSISHPAIDLIGYRDLSFLGRPAAWQNCIAACDRARFDVACEALSSCPECVCEYRMVRADGREIWVRSHLSRLRRESRFLIAAITTDITRERHSDHLRLAALEDVAAGMVNVINNALTVIHANLELETETGSSTGTNGSPPSRFLMDARQAAKRAARVLGQIRVFAKGQYLRSRVIKANEILQSGMDAFRLQCGPLASLDVELQPDLWEIHTDPDQLTLAIGHLCENCARAMPSGGRVRLATRNLHARDLPLEDSGCLQEWVEISLEDTGTGMTPEVLERAIEPFYSTADSADRLGLGLSMVHGFVSQSGGVLSLRSVRGSGTTVSLRFPRRLAPATDSLAAPTCSDEPIVLIVDSDESVRKSTAMLVERLGHRTMTAASADAALPIVSTRTVKILLTDLPLHGGGDNGMTLARRLSDMIPQLGIILMTGSGSLEDLNDTVPESWVILEKPFSLEDLSASLIAAHRAQSEESVGARLLTAREREVLQWISTGRSQAETALLLNISERTVEQHVRNARLKLNAVNTIQAVVDAIARGEIQPPA